jgi:hypothetical protein
LTASLAGLGRRAISSAFHCATDARYAKDPLRVTPRYVAPAVLIHRRPPIVETRTRIGDWEGDLIVGKHSRSAIGTLVDRTSRAVRLIHLPYGHSAEAFTDAFANVLGALPEAARRTLTWDQGSEMARHDVLAEHFDDGVFFADPGSPWQRGTNENTNGLLRQFFPKGKDLSIYTPEDLARAEKLLNSRPARSSTGVHQTWSSHTDYSDSVRVLRGPDEFTLELVRRKRVNFRPPLTRARRRPDRSKCVARRSTRSSTEADGQWTDLGPLSGPRYCSNRTIDVQ